MSKHDFLAVELTNSINRTREAISADGIDRLLHRKP
jgi:hypothetical protein